MSVIVFGSFARREAETDSDIDLLVGRPAGADEDDDEWSASLEGWHHDVRRLTGDAVDVLEVSAGEAATKLDGRTLVWAAIRCDGRVVAATSLAIHAGINSADAICGARLGTRAAGEDHDQVLALLRQAGPDGAEVEVAADPCCWYEWTRS